MGGPMIDALRNILLEERNMHFKSSFNEAAARSINTPAPNELQAYVY
ncbi:MAG: hypothetical protein QOI12_2134 [Alphaproteobacteria bacterium]|jgi:hypothetical protein|nr:hypothetical protein [Alphaproteobacteria bacterium]